MKNQEPFSDSSAVSDGIL
uniref:Uncharacterized protein n=2 Tax=Anguilla anguilla TaxID=7936 RepID=A0A0E9XN70_ANGAN